MSDKMISNSHDNTISKINSEINNNSELTINQITDTQSISCPFCMYDFLKEDLYSICGNLECTTQVCGECIIKWCGLNGPGKIFNTNFIKCPFCDQAQTDDILIHYYDCMDVTMNAYNLRIFKELNDECWYGWCIECNKIHKITEKNVLPEQPELDDKYVCQECQEWQERQECREYDEYDDDTDSDCGGVGCWKYIGYHKCSGCPGGCWQCEN